MEGNGPEGRRAAAVVALVEQLVHRSLGDIRGVAPARRKQATDRLVAYSMSLLGSRMSASAPSELALSERISRALARVRGADAPNLELRELLGELHSLSASLDDDVDDEPPPLPHEHRIAALQLLTELTGSAHEGGAGLIVGRAGCVAALPADASDGGGARASLWHQRAGGGGGACAHAPARFDSSEADVVAVLAQRFDAVSEREGALYPPPARPDAAANPSRALRAHAASVSACESVATELARAALVRAALYAMQAISSKQIAFTREAAGAARPGRTARAEPAAAGVAVAVERSLPASERALLLELGALGLLFHRCHAFAHGGTAEGGEGGGGGGDAGFVRQALCATMRRELDDYFRLLSLLDAERLAAARADSGAGAPARLSLRKLLLWAHEPRLRLEVMCSLVERCAHERGGALANALGACEQHGDAFVRRYAARFSAQAGAPLLQMLSAWLTQGALDDPHGEFFIEARLERRAAAVAAQPYAAQPQPPAAASFAEKDAEVLWNSRYALRTAMLPSHLSLALATQILVVGKSVRLLRECAAPGERGWVAQRLALASPPPAAWRDAAALAVFTERIASEVQPQIVSLLVDEHRLLEHLRAVRAFLLLAQGDFAQLLMDSLVLELSRPAHELHRHALLSIVDGAVRASTALVETPADCVARLQVAVRHEPDESGWEAFSLDYHAGGSPISAVLTREALVTYRRLFHFLWRLKRAEHVLAAVWRQHTTVLRLFRPLHGSAPMRGFQRLRHELLSFVHHMIYHAMAEVLEGCWSQLLEKLAKAKDLHEICAAHQAYLCAMVDDGLFLDKAAFTEPVRAITQVAFDFGQAQERLYLALLEHDERARGASAKRQLNTAAGRWATVDGSEADSLRPISAGFEQQVEELRARFHDEFDKFFALVSRHPSPNLAFLAARLDFNGFHGARNYATHADASNDESAHGGWTGGFGGNESPH